LLHDPALAYDLLMTSRFLFAAIVAGLTLVTAPADAQVNVTGTWQPKMWSLKIALRQEGTRVWGFGGAQDFWFRGQWDGDRLVLVATNFTEKRKNTCKPRGVFTLSGKSVSMLDSVWFQSDTGRTLKGPWVRLSPDAGEPTAYPYATELMYCGTLQTYELAFASAADTLQGTDWPILSAVAGVLKQDGALKIEVVGHTDSTGDAKANQGLSERRAAAVKQALVATYGADASRITTKGWGAEQPIQDNKTPDGRAMNRRVEIVRAR
jgi:outer membrane protein OmpA-like peptidoglycan-associated protein